MDNKTLSALTLLAQKLGTTAEHLWNVLLKQAPISATIEVFVMVAWVALLVGWGWFIKNKTDPRGPVWEDELGIGLAWASVGLAALLVAGIIGIELPLLVSAFVNPEYWALHQILGGQ